MGDIIEFVTSPSLGHRCFKITSNGINFDIMTTENATLVLSRKYVERDDFVWVTIENGSSYMGKDGVSKVRANTPEIIAGNYYNRFWIVWFGNVISLGKNGHVEPILQYPWKSQKSIYVTFLTHEGSHSTYWKIELPPLLKKPSMKQISKGDLYWVPSPSQLPHDALIGGFEKETLYIMRAPHRGSLSPGKFVPSERCGYIAWGYEAHEKTEFEVLCGYNCKWVQSREDKIPMGAVEGGYSEVQREVLYIGRALHCGHIIPGKVAPSHRVCYIPYNGRTVAVEKYEILTLPRDWRCVNKYILPCKTSDNRELNDAYSDEVNFNFVVSSNR